MKKRAIALFLSLAICMGLAAQTTAYAATELDPQRLYQSMIAMKSQYPEGMTWNNSNYYAWKGGIFSGGYGCAGFAFLLSDAAFGTLPARRLTDFTYSDVRVGDILRINHDTHSVIVLEVHEDAVVIAEGNYNNAIHWGRTLSRAQVLAADYIITRYPEYEPDEDISPAFTDVSPDAYYANAVVWAVEKGITTGTGNTTFSPDNVCTRAEAVTFLHRAAGSPKPASTVNPFTDIRPGEYYYEAVLWAVQNGITQGTDSATFSPGRTCTRDQIVTFLWRANGEPSLAGRSGFTDVDSSAYYADAVAWAVAKGVTQGTSATTFSPGIACTRGQTVTFLYRSQNG